MGNVPPAGAPCTESAPMRCASPVVHSGPLPLAGHQHMHRYLCNSLSVQGPGGVPQPFAIDLPLHFVLRSGPNARDPPIVCGKMTTAELFERDLSNGQTTTSMGY